MKLKKCKTFGCENKFKHSNKRVEYCPDCLRQRTIKLRNYTLVPPPNVSERFNGCQIIRSDEYQDYIHSEVWKKKADRLKINNPRCSLCNRRAKDVVLNVHHRTYLRLGAELDTDLIVLCRDCHEMFTNNYRYNKLLGVHEPKQVTNAQ